MTKAIDAENRVDYMNSEALTVRKEGSVLFAEIAAPPMNLTGPGFYRDLVSLIQRAEADDAVHVVVFKSADPDYFIAHVDVTRIKENREAVARLAGEAPVGLLRRVLDGDATSFGRDREFVFPVRRLKNLNQKN